MPQRIRKTIDTGVYLVNGVVYLERTKGGKLHRRKARLQFSAALNSRGLPTQELKQEYREFCDAIENEEFREIKRARSCSPSVEAFADLYRKSAEVEFSKYGQPRPVTVNNNATAFLFIARECGAARIDALDGAAVERWVARRCAAEALGEGGIDRARVSAWSTVNQARSLWAKWARPYYAASHIELPPCLFNWSMPKRGAMSRRYVRPPEDLRRATFDWYNKLEKEDAVLWLAATLYVQFSMRPVDSAELRWSNFERREDGNWTLHYVPSKTRERTNRQREVRWPVAEDLMRRMYAAGAEDYLLPGATHVERYAIYIRRLNKQIRKLGWTRERYGKAGYELRKMCVDAVNQKHGMARAVQVSGDNAQTVMAYYADPNADRLEPMDITRM
jgi:hypothetical protein